MISFRHKGDFSKLDKFLAHNKKPSDIRVLEHYAWRGVSALSSATPEDTGVTAKSWYYEIHETDGGITISFNNSNIQNGVPIAIILQYGHGTRNGGWVEGRDYINPAIQPIFDNIVEEVWKEVRGS